MKVSLIGDLKVSLIGDMNGENSIELEIDLRISSYEIPNSTNAVLKQVNDFGMKRISNNRWIP